MTHTLYPQQPPLPPSTKHYLSPDIAFSYFRFFPLAHVVALTFNSSLAARLDTKHERS